MLININSVIALLQGVTACSKWVDLCKHSRVEKQSSASDYHFYIYSHVPFPVKGRGIVVHITWQQGPKTLAVTMDGRAVIGRTEKPVQCVYKQHTLNGA